MIDALEAHAEAARWLAWFASMQDHDEAPRDPDARPDAGGGAAAAPRGEDAGERACRACGEPPPWLRTLATTFAPIVACALVCALVMHKLEGWSFFHAFYYAIITGASIGYGDFFPVTKPHPPASSLSKPLLPARRPTS